MFQRICEAFERMATAAERQASAVEDQTAAAKVYFAGMNRLTFATVVEREESAKRLREEIAFMREKRERRNQCQAESKIPEGWEGK